ncbi:MAG TPA: nitrilase-related carbon-nitrogen hydrolase [Burkholderiaceae bacterium]|nr:nitrilase-related carbon-nitrogen hydrolase [Burkholderiaceae bacterium]
MSALRVAIAQLPMQWTTACNLVQIEAALRLAAARGAALCVLPELALTGFHRQIRTEAVAETVDAALAQLQAACRALDIACAVGAPTFGAGGAIYNSCLFIDERGARVGQVDKTGLTVAEATFFHGGRGRPVALLRGLKTSAVMCREIEDLALVRHHLPAGAAELIVWPGLMGRAPDGEEVVDIEALAQQQARQAQAHVVQSNWPNALNLPDDSPFQAALGASKVFSPAGDRLLMLPPRASGVGTFDLGATEFAWDALPAP